MTALDWLQTGVASFFEYDTPRIVHIRSKKIGVLSRFVQLCIISYVVGYVMVYNKGYQEKEKLVAAVTSKVKLTGSILLSMYTARPGSSVWSQHYWTSGLASLCSPSLLSSVTSSSSTVIRTESTTKTRNFSTSTQRTLGRASPDLALTIQTTGNQKQTVLLREICEPFYFYTENLSMCWHLVRGIIFVR